MTLIPDLREFIELLNSRGVQYVIVGGWAVNNYLEPRVTGDIDFFVSRSTQNQARLRRVLADFGFSSTLPPAAKELLPAGKILMLGMQPNRIDLLTHIDGVTFQQAWATRSKGELDELPVAFLSAQNLLCNKRAADRLKDRADAEGLARLLESDSRSKTPSTEQRSLRRVRREKKLRTGCEKKRRGMRR